MFRQDLEEKVRATTGKRTSTGRNEGERLVILADFMSLIKIINRLICQLFEIFTERLVFIIEFVSKHVTILTNCMSRSVIKDEPS